MCRKVRLACAEGESQRQAARHFTISRDSVRKILAFSAPPGWPKLDGFTAIIDGWLEDDHGGAASSGARPNGRRMMGGKERMSENR